MANNPPEIYAADGFLEQILAIPSYASLPVTDISAGASSENSASGISQLQQQRLFPLGLSLDNGFADANNIGGFQVKTEREAMHMGNLYSGLEHLQSHAVCLSVPQVHQVQPFQGHPTSSTPVTIPHQPAIRPRVRARRGQATDPHSIAERLRRERISERIKALQELVPSCNKHLKSELDNARTYIKRVEELGKERRYQEPEEMVEVNTIMYMVVSLEGKKHHNRSNSIHKTDRAAMVDEILDYVKFLRLQVKVLSMSRLGGTSAVAQLVADIPLQSVEGDSCESRSNQHVWEKWSDSETEQEVAKLMGEDVGTAMQYLQSKSLCIMPVSLAALIYPTQQTDDQSMVKPEPTAPS